MRVVKWAFWIIVVAVVGAFLWYTLPRHQVAYITAASNRVVTFGENSWFWSNPSVGTNVQAGMVSRDVFFIDTVRPSGRVKVFRNEDTGAGWPPYFKFDSANLQAEAQNLVSTQANPRWVVITYYGWRQEWLSSFPNALAIREVEGPDARVIPWFNIVFFTLLAAIVWAVRARWVRWRRRRADPMAASWQPDGQRRSWFGWK